MKNPHITKFFFGTQYYRPPTPPTDEWEDDLKRMKDLNFNAIKIWIQWRWVESVKGEYRFEDFDRMFDLCDKYEMGLVPNTILECAPEWAYREFPDARVLTMERQKRYEWGASAYQVGGFRPCWDHPRMSALGLECLRRIVGRYAGRACLAAWDVWNEPLQEFCCCENTHGAFVAWLKTQFGSLAELNEFLGRRYGTFEEVPVPYGAEAYPHMQLMYRFMHDRLAEQIGWRSEIVRETDPATPVMTHSCGPGSSVYHLNGDDWKNAAVVDFYGTSMHQWSNLFAASEPSRGWTRFPLCLDATYAASPYYWVSELASGESHRGFAANKIERDDVRFWTWTCIAHGAKALLYWQFKPERLGSEAPGWGLVALDGRLLDRTAEAKEAAQFTRDWNDFLIGASPVFDRVGVLFDADTQTMSHHASEYWKQGTPYTDAVRGAYQSLWYNHLAPRVVTRFEDWSEVDAVYLPFPIRLTNELAEKIRAYVVGGGTVISEGGLGTYDHRTWHSTRIPGGGLEDVFSLRELDVVLQRHGLADSAENDLNMEFSYRVPGAADGKARGTLFKRSIEPIDAEVLGVFTHGGEPAFLRNNFGKGTAYYIATHPSVQAARSWDETTMLGIRNIIGCAVQPRYVLDRKGFITARLLERDSESLLFVFNHEPEGRSALFQMAGSAKLEAVRGAAPVRDKGFFKLELAPRDVAVYHLSR